MKSGRFPILAYAILLAFDGCVQWDSYKDDERSYSAFSRTIIRLREQSYESLISTATVASKRISGMDTGVVRISSAHVFSGLQEIRYLEEYDAPQYDRVFEMTIFGEDSARSFYGMKAGINLTSHTDVVNIGLFPHKVGSSLSLSDILDPVPPSQRYTWTWIGDPSGGGSQGSVHYSGDTLVLDSAARVHFTTQDSTFGNGSYVFRFKAHALDFGWRIPDSSSGKSIRLAYDPVGSPNQIKLIRGSWANQSVDFADSLEYMYEPDLWHVVQIVDSSGTLGIYFDGIKLDFFQTRAASQYLSGLGSGGIGIGTRNSGMKVSAMMGLR